METSIPVEKYIRYSQYYGELEICKGNNKPNVLIIMLYGGSPAFMSFIYAVI